MEKKDFKDRLLLGTLLSAVFVVLWNGDRTIPAIASFLSSVLVPVFWGIVIAFIISIPAGAIEKRIGKRGLSIALSFILILLAVIIILVLVIPEFISACSILINAIEDFASNHELWSTLKLDTIPVIGTYFERADDGLLQITEELRNIIERYKETILETTVQSVISLIRMISTLFVGVVLSFYFLSNKELLTDDFQNVLSLRADRKTIDRINHLAALSQKAFSNFIVGQVTECIIIGVICFIGMLVFRLPNAGSISAFVGLTAFVPIYGAFIGAFAGAFIIAVESPLKGLIFLIFIFVLQQLEGDLIYPKVVGSSTNMPSVYIFLSVTIGGLLFGLAGMLFAVPVFSILYHLLKERTEGESAIGKEMGS